MQGEGDSNEKLAAVYLDKLEVLISHISNLTGEKYMPVVVGDLGNFKPNYLLINDELQKAPLRIKNLEVARSEGFIDKGDKTHFDSKSALEYGKRFAEEMGKLKK